MVTKAASGHPGGSMSSTDIMTWLFFKEMNVTPETWKRSGENLDMFFLSAGHMTPVLYSVMARRGYFPVDELNTFRLFGTRLQGHPCIEKGLPGINQAAGSLGQGLSVAAGAAAGKKIAGDNNFVFCLVGDGESEEGQVWEAAMFAAHYHLDNLCALLDWNGLQIDGAVADVMNPTPLDKKFEAFGWHVICVDGHDFEQLEAAYAEAKTVKGQPTLILAKTTKGKGVSFMENQVGWHGKAPNEEQRQQALKELEG